MFNQKCLSALLKQSFVDFEIIFVDNASTDWSLEEVEKVFSHEIESWKIKIVRNTENLWFAEGSNVWFLNVSDEVEYLWLLNNDTIADENALKMLLSAMQLDVSIWATWSYVIDNWLEHAYNELYFNKWLKTKINYILETSFEPDPTMNNWFYASWIWWCSILIKRFLIDKEIFPPFYFAYCEDGYFSFNTLFKWYKLFITFDSIIHHYWSWTSWKDVTVFKAFHWTKNQIANFFIFHSRINIFKILPVFIIYQILKLFSWWFLIRLKWLYKAIIWTISNRKLIADKRKEVLATKKISDKEFISMLSPKILENIYFFEIGRFRRAMIELFNKFFLFYFKLIRIR